ncbi:MAG: putative metal-binding motif-containing protein [Archangium sp.]
MRRSLALASVVLISACSGGRGDVIRVTLETGEERAETCYLVEVLEQGGRARQASVAFPRDAAKETQNYVVAIARPGFGATISLRATALIGADCMTADKPNGVSALVDATFDSNRIVDATLSLVEGDVDSDGFVSTTRGGGDCNDADDSVSPGAKEQCFGTVDHDCNGKTACSDPACQGMACAGVPTKLAISDAPSSIRVSECAGPLTVVVRDANEALTSPAVGATLMLGGPFTFFTESSCSGAPTTGLSLMSAQSVWLRATMPQTADVVVTSPGLESASRSIVVLPSGPTGVAFSNPPVRVNAGGCSPELIIALVDDAGSRTFSQQPVTVALTSDAGAPFHFFTDMMCTQQVSSIDITDGGEAAVRYSGTVAGQFSVRASTSGPFVASVEQAANIDPSMATSLASNGPAVIAAGECAGPFVLSGRDMYGNVTSVSGALATVPMDAGLTVFTSPACLMAGQPGATYGVIANEEGQFTISLTSGSTLMATQQLTVRKRGPMGGRFRWPLTVSAGVGAVAPTGGYTRYSLQTVFDARDAIDAGMVSANGNDLRVYFASDAGWVEVDRLVQSVDAGTMRVWFPAQADLAMGVPDTRYSLFAGPFNGASALARPEKVYLFHDDFEGGTLANWSIRRGPWTWANDRAHGGTGALKFPTETMDIDQFIEVTPALNEADVLLEAWWFTDNTGDTNFSQCVRVQPGNPTMLNHYETTLEDTTGWTLARMNNGSWSEVATNSSAPIQNQWMRVGVSMRDRDMNVFRDGVRIFPAVQVVPGGPTSGNIGFRKWSVGGSVWLDDVILRRFADPEPVVTSGAPIVMPQ